MNRPGLSTHRQGCRPHSQNSAEDKSKHSRLHRQVSLQGFPSTMEIWASILAMDKGSSAESRPALGGLHLSNNAGDDCRQSRSLRECEAPCVRTRELAFLDCFGSFLPDRSLDAVLGNLGGLIPLLRPRIPRLAQPPGLRGPGARPRAVDNPHSS